ncbi:four-carbon acid sugar kinase family protein [Planococcus sp. YIM B11945]|uniref:four-carbon acid sugar kinase family protein n=1 Tax=Planococcus sp. YIM B11945 TaxID=3435410 RepID=UPI003D7D029D
MQKNQLMLAFYGDDFTGSTDAMEALAMNGYRTILFLKPPSPELLGRFEEIRCIGVAGTSRAKNPEEMEKELQPIMAELFNSGAPIVHYKTCSTFDSSPDIGSIGKAIQVARRFNGGQKTIPLLVGAPALGRFTLFGNHFARMGADVYRLDRHPIMSKHPITPMAEADLRLHLGKQLDEPIGLMNILELEGDYSGVQKRYAEKLEEQSSVILFDVLDEERLEKSGRLLWESAAAEPQFVVGSSGVEYALTAHWKQTGLPREAGRKTKHVQAVDTLLAVSGSASSVSQKQIERAIEQGFYGVKIPVELLVGSETLPHGFLEEPIRRLKSGQSVVLYSALGPDDKAIGETRKHFNEKGMADTDSGAFIGRQLGRWTKHIMHEAGIRRVVIAGGDTSGFVTSEMDVYGLEVLLSVSPGAPLCMVYSENPEMEGVELALKGGQFGGVDYFTDVRDAKSS